MATCHRSRRCTLQVPCHRMSRTCSCVTPCKTRMIGSQSTEISCSLVRYSTNLMHLDRASSGPEIRIQFRARSRSGGLSPRSRRPRTTAATGVSKSEESSEEQALHPHGTGQTVGTHQNTSMAGHRQHCGMINDETSSTEFIVVINWFEELKRLVPSDNLGRRSRVCPLPTIVVTSSP